MTTAAATRSNHEDDIRLVGQSLARTVEANTVGRRLQARREELGMFQAQVAEAMGLSRTAYCQYETGSTSMTTLKVERAARVLRTRPEWLAFGVGERNAVEEVSFNGAEFERSGIWSLAESWLMRSFGLATHEVALFAVQAPVGDLVAGDVAVISTSAKPVNAPAQFLCVIGGEANIATVSRLAKGGYRVFGPNKTYEDVENTDMKVFGKVVGRMGAV